MGDDDEQPQQPAVAVVGVLAQAQRVRHLHEEYLAADKAKQESPGDLRLRSTRDRLIAELSVVAFSAQPGSAPASPGRST